MASLIENLIDVLEKENIEYKSLLEISKEKTGAIIKNDTEQLQILAGREQKLIEKLDALESAREEHIGDISDVLNVPVEEMKVSLLIRLMEKQPKDQAALIKIHDELKSTMDQLIMLNNNNKVLLQESLDMLEFEINLIRNSKMAPATANYDKGAYGVSQTDVGMGTFDAKQ